MNRKVLMVVNKTSGQLAPSETFLRAQIEGLPAQVTPLIGNPGRRCINGAEGIRQYLMSPSPLARGFRWVRRSVGAGSVASQDSKALEACLRRERFDVVLAQYGPTAVSVMDACDRADVPLVAHFHGYDAYTHYCLEQYSSQYEKLFRQAAAVIAVSTDMRAKLLELGANPEKTFYSPCGTAIPLHVMADPANAPLRFVMIGRLADKKAPMVSILAFRQLVGIHPESVLEIIGDGPLRQACEQLTVTLKLQGNIIFHGAKPHAFVMERLAQARCFLQHSVCAQNGDREGTPVSVLEAMGMGLPVVSTRHGGILDAIDSDAVGRLVDEYDIDGMAQAMLRLAEDNEYAGQIGRLARERIMAGWTSQHSIDRLWKILEGTMNA